MDLAEHIGSNWGDYKSTESQQTKSCWFLVRGENRSTWGKPSGNRVENQQTQSTHDDGSRFGTLAILVEGGCSQHGANPALMTNQLADYMKTIFDRSFGEAYLLSFPNRS